MNEANQKRLHTMWVQLWHFGKSQMMHISERLVACGEREQQAENKKFQGSVSTVYGIIEVHMSVYVCANS